MTKRNQKTGLLVTALIICAVLARIAGNAGILSIPLGLSRTVIYIGLYIGWGFSVNRRILQVQVRRYMIGVSFLTVFWFIVRSMKYYFVVNPNVDRHLWYWYYFPMLFIPLLAYLLHVAGQAGGLPPAQMDNSAIYSHPAFPAAGAVKRFSPACFFLSRWNGLERFG